jgi:hypothetical protein
VPQKLPRFYLRQQKAEDEHRLAKIVLEADVVDEAPRLVNGADGHNWERRRGLPLISKGVRGRCRVPIRLERCSRRRTGDGDGR